ncbi:MAG: DUF305 domain-containing protein [Chitinophagales bacterium]|nr:DUF305 domain-containing protein [Chitinophagales bacterium]
MKKISLFLSLGMMVSGILIGITIGYYLTPEYQTTMFTKNAMNLGQADRTFDLRYINAMIAHHRGAMLLADQLNKNTTRPEMKALSEEILKNEPIAIAELYKWKKDWYNDTRTIQDPVVANLGNADDSFDLRFLNAIIAHHEAGILMTKETHTKSSRTEILNNANTVEQFLSNGIETLKGLRKTWYNI